MVPYINALPIGVAGVAIEYYKTQVCGSGFLLAITYNWFKFFCFVFSIVLWQTIPRAAYTNKVDFYRFFKNSNLKLFILISIRCILQLEITLIQVLQDRLFKNSQFWNMKNLIRQEKFHWISFIWSYISLKLQVSGKQL